jgi:pimeloyl-ACP methyl ester carboxylesterase
VLYAAFERANRVVSPYSRPPKVSSERTFVLGAEGDAITGVEHARRIAGHLGARLEVVAGGHLLQFWRDALVRGLEPILSDLGRDVRRPSPTPR